MILMELIDGSYRLEEERHITLPWPPTLESPLGEGYGPRYYPNMHLIAVMLTIASLISPQTLPSGRALHYRGATQQSP